MGQEEGEGIWKPPVSFTQSLSRRKIVSLSLEFRIRRLSRKINGDVSVFSKI